MPLKVCNIHNVIDNIVDTTDLVVSILDSKKDAPNIPLEVPCIQVIFPDTEHPNDLEYMKMYHGVKRILDFIKSRPDITLSSDIIVHCHAGVSRSSAVAWLILIALGMDYKNAFTMLYKQHPNIWPNTTVLSLGSGFLKLPPEFDAFVTQVNTEISQNRSGYLGYGG